MPIECGPSLGVMGSSGTGKSFSVAENERLRGLARGMLEKADNNQRRLADILGVAQPTVSNFIAVAHKVDVLDRVPHGAGAECCDGHRIWYRWHPSKRTRGSRIFHGLSHCGFILAGWRGHTEVDAWNLNAELALQLEIAEEARTLREAMRVQPHADPWLLRAQLRRARLIDAA